SLYPDQFVDRFDHMDRDTDSPCLVGNGARNGLADPPRGIGAEFKAFRVVEFLDRFDKPHIPFLDQVQEQHAAAYIAFRDRYDETQVGFSKAFFRFFVALFNECRKANFFFRLQQVNPADLFQVHAYRVVDLDAWRNAQVVQVEL